MHPDQEKISRRNHAKLGAKAFRHNVGHAQIFVLCTDAQVKSL